MPERTKWTTQELLNLQVDESVAPARIVIGQAAWNGSSWVASDYNPLAGYSISDKDDDASPNYFGFQKPDGSFHILKETISAGNDSYRYFAGTSDYGTNWTNRASKTYLNLSAAF